MAQSTTLILLPQTTWQRDPHATSPIYSVVGTKQPAASYYLSSKDLQTVHINGVGVTGNINIQATLVANPSETDWFNVHTIAANATEHGCNACADTCINQGVNISGNYVWMRASIIDFAGGTVQYIKMSY